MSSYPDGGYRNHMGVAHSFCYKILSTEYHINDVFSVKSQFSFQMQKGDGASAPPQTKVLFLCHVNSLS